MVWKIPAVALVTLLWLCQLARADESSKTAKIEELMQLTHAEAAVAQMTSQIRAMMVNQVESMGVPPESKGAALEFMNKFADQISHLMDWQKLKPEYIKLYADVFTEEEIEGIAAFYRTPAGHAMIEKMPALLSQSMALGQRRMAALMPEIQKTVEDLKQKYKNAPKQ